jgi:hypothetical protein
MVDLEDQKHCGVALLTTPGMPMFAIRRNRKYHAGMHSHVQPLEAAMQTWTYVLINFQKV